MNKFFNAFRNVRTSSSFRSKSVITSQINKNITAGQAALNQVDKLSKERKLKEALILIDEIEIKYPSCLKAAKHYRGEIYYSYLV